MPRKRSDERNEREPSSNGVAVNLDALRRFTAEAGLTIQTLAEKVPISFRQLQRIFAGQSKPQLANLKYITDAIEKDLKDVLAPSLPVEPPPSSQFTIDLSISGFTISSQPFQDVMAKLQQFVGSLSNEETAISDPDCTVNIAKETKHGIIFISVSGIMGEGELAWGAYLMTTKKYKEYLDVSRHTATEKEVISPAKFGIELVQKSGVMPDGLTLDAIVAAEIFNLLFENRDLLRELSDIEAGVTGEREKHYRHDDGQDCFCFSRLFPHL